MEAELVKQIGTRIREERLNRRWTQKMLTAKANVLWQEKFPDQPPIQEKWLWTLEHAKVLSTNLDWVAALAGALRITLDALLKPSPITETVAHEHGWRVVLRMHGIDAATVEDIVHQVRLLSDSDES